MTEIMYTGTLLGPELTELIYACNFPQDTRFLGEQLPEHIVNDRQQKDFLVFTWYASRLPFSSYNTGRIFHEQGELRWESRADTFQIVYLGSEQYSDILISHKCEIQPEFTALLHKKELHSILKNYILFGKVLAPEIGTPENHSTYAEARIPRLLHYPLHKSQQQQSTERVEISVIEYTHKGTGQILASRFQALQPMSSQKDQQTREHNSI